MRYMNIKRSSHIDKYLRAYYILTMITVLSAGVYAQLSQIPDFSTENGHTYLTYLHYVINHTPDIPTHISETVKTLTSTKDVFDYMQRQGFPLISETTVKNIRIT